MGAVTCDGQPPLPLTLTGMCVDATAEPTTLSFKTRVREPATQTIPVKNTSASLWRIHPIVQDESWSGDDLLEVAAGATANYVVTYCPMTMTSDGATHQGSAFFPLADGSAILYTLVGTAEPPEEARPPSTPAPPFSRARA